jgi:hypothetical protein
VLKNLRRPTAGLSTDSNDDVMVMVILPVIEMCVSPPRIGEANLSRRFAAHLRLRQKASQRREKKVLEPKSLTLTGQSVLVSVSVL